MREYDHEDAVVVQSLQRLVGTVRIGVVAMYQFAEQFADYFSGAAMSVESHGDDLAGAGALLNNLVAQFRLPESRNPVAAVGRRFALDVYALAKALADHLAPAGHSEGSTSPEAAMIYFDVSPGLELLPPLLAVRNSMDDANKFLSDYSVTRRLVPMLFGTQLGADTFSYTQKDVMDTGRTARKAMLAALRPAQDHPLYDKVRDDVQAQFGSMCEGCGAVNKKMSYCAGCGAVAYVCPCVFHPLMPLPWC